MGITVEFKDYEEMVAFARVLLSGVPTVKQEEPKQRTAKVDKPEVKEGIPAVIENEVPFEEDAPAQDEPTYTLEQVRAKLTELTRAGKQKEVKEIITAFGAKNVTSILPEHYAGVMEKAEAL